jgi:uncharacterized protein YbjT (DUF2867 family)
MTDRILVFGATGDQGHSLMLRLLAAGHQVRAATRDPANFPTSVFPGAEAVAADFADAASLDRAAQGMDGIVMHLPFVFDRAYAVTMGRNIAAAARNARCRRIVFHTSCVVMDEDLDLTGHDSRRDIERELLASGVGCVFIRSAVFMDNIVRVWAKPSVVNHGVFAYACKPDLKISWVAQDDIAAAMVAAWAHPAPAPTYLVGGPEALTGDEVAARLSAAAGKPIRFQSLHPDEFASRMSLLVTGSPSFEPDSIWGRMAGFYRWYNAQPQSPLVVDLRPLLADLAYRPTPLLVWAGEQDWTRV